MPVFHNSDLQTSPCSAGTAARRRQSTVPPTGPAWGVAAAHTLPAQSTITFLLPKRSSWHMLGVLCGLLDEEMDAGRKEEGKKWREERRK